MKKEEFLDYFLNVPISINNLYGDPFFPSQIENTFDKLEKLKSDKHKGIISIITKTEISEEITKRLQTYLRDLNLIILVSISGLSYSIEKIKGNRYRTLSLCNQYSIPCLAYVRPFIPNENTDEDTIMHIFEHIKATGTNTIVVSGLRGNDDVLTNLNFDEDEFKNWSLRVKIMPPNVKKIIEKMEEKYELQIFERTSCGVSYVLNKSHSYNPYYASPQLAKCEKCPLRETCYDIQDNFYPTKKDLELVELLHYKCNHVNNDSFEICKVNPAKRTECISCCTSCFRLKRDAIEVEKFNDICLGDIGLLRLLLHKLVFCKGIIDNGDSTVARPKNEFLKDQNLYILNSWWSFSHNIQSCYGCSYCIVPTYHNKNDNEYGNTPLTVANSLIEKIEEEGVKFDE